MIDLRKFKGIIPESEFSKIADYSIHLNFSKTTRKSFNIDKSQKTLTINVECLPSKEKKNLKAIINSCIENDTAILISHEKSDLLERLYHYNDTQDNQILTFFERILSKVDWEALRDSLFLRNEFKCRRNITVLKNDIKIRYGERGKTISNLCTAGYFEEVMIPLYNLGKSEFWKYWDLALDKGITALFVHSQMDTATINDEIKRRLSLGKKYGLKYIHIHGIGSKNTSKIEKCIKNEKGSLQFTEKHIFTEKSLNVIVVELIL